MKIDEIYRASWVKRWGIVRTLRDQNIAEHSFLVAMIAGELMGRVGFPIDEGGGLSGARAGEVYRWALWHDLAEVFTGDVPTPTKTRIRMHGKIMEAIEDELAPMVAEVRNATGGFTKDVVKVADYLEAILFLQREGGNDEAESVRQLLMEQLIEFIDNWNSTMRRHYEAIVLLSEDMSIDGLRQIPRVS